MNYKKVGVIVLCGERFQNIFYKSYLKCEAGLNHDLIIVHRDFNFINNKIENKNGLIYTLNKVINGKDTPHKAFGGYRFAFNAIKDQFDILIFLSDDVVLKRDYWLKDIVDTLNIHEKLGFGASQIFNGNKKYPHKSHLRAPFWFAKTKALNEINWEFNSDEEGEMFTANQLTSAGYFGVQVGNKINLGYDAFEPFHITAILENRFSNSSFPDGKINFDCFKDFKIDQLIESPYEHIGIQAVLQDLEPFDKLIYYPSLEIAKQYVQIKNTGFNSFTLYV